jgi:radical SAM protein with 4Fe4S-binding SPASM domain
MPYEQAEKIIDQAFDRGLKSVVYLGGEPLLYPNFWQLIDYMMRRNITPVIISNGTLITDSVASRLYDLGASVIVKFDGLEEIQDMLSGIGSFKKINRGFNSLLKSGFANHGKNFTRLGAAPCATTINYRGIPDLWRFFRQHNVYPNVERMTVVGRVSHDLELNAEQVYWLYDTLREIDLKEFGINWGAPYSAIPNHSCFIFLSGCHITAQGDVCLCPELPPVANLRDTSLNEILDGGSFKEARRIDRLIQEPCSSCTHFKVCLGGCRSKANHNRNGSIFDVDPFCILLNKRGYEDCK